MSDRKLDTKVSWSEEHQVNKNKTTNTAKLMLFKPSTRWDHPSLLTEKSPMKLKENTWSTKTWKSSETEPTVKT